MRLLTALLASALALTQGTGMAQLLPAGEFAARDGRPGPGQTWKLSDAKGRALAAQLNQVAARTPIVIDYDHQTIRAEANGQKAPAAGWILSAEWRDGQGLYAKVDWTPAAKAHIDAGEYRYISPVIFYDETSGAVTGVAMASLVNLPAIVGMDAVAAQAALHFQLPKDPDMSTLLAALIATLGLPAAATEAEVTSAVKALKDKPALAPLPAALATALGVKPEADEATALAAVTTLKAAGANALTPVVTELQGQIVALTARVAQAEGDKVLQMVDKAIAEGRLAPASKDAYVKLGRENLATLGTILAAAPVIPGLKGQTGGTDPNGTGGTGAAALSATQALICKQLGLEPAKYAEHLAEQDRAAAARQAA